MTPARGALLLVERHLVERVHQLADTDQEWSAEFIAVAQALALVVGQLRADPGEMLTTREMAERLAIAPSTLRRKGRTGQIAAPTRFAKRGAAALRWRAQA